MGSYPLGVAADPATSTIYVVNSVSNSVSMIDGRPNVLRETAPTGEMPESVIVDVTSNTVFVSNFGSDTISILPG